MLINNPRAKIAKLLGKSATDLQAAEDAVLAYCDAHDDQAQLDDKDVRAVHPLLTDERVWNEVRKALAL